jgi:hypothetical protein
LRAGIAAAKKAMKTWGETEEVPVVPKEDLLDSY